MTLPYDGGMQSAQTEAPHGDVMFILPGEHPSAGVQVTAAGYVDCTGTLRLSARPHVGGRGFWIGIVAEP